jgi:predicted ATPase
MTNTYQQTKNNISRIAISGGPGVGKSTVLQLLAQRGYQTIPEAARIIIEREQLKDSDCLPWKNVPKFQQAVSELQLSLENSISEGIIFSDRGIIDGHAYSKIDKIETPKLVLDNSKGRYQAVFILDQLPVYEQDKIRWDDVERAKLIQQTVKDSYRHFGYNPIAVPVLSAEERTDFILSKINHGEK